MQDVKIKAKNTFISDSNEHLVRPRISTLLAQAVKLPLTLVCAGMGCGKTRAVYDFTQECKFPVMWLQFSDSENPGPQFWEMFVRAVAQTNPPLAKEFKKLGLPDTPDKLHMYFELRSRMQKNIPQLYVLDDFHIVKDATVLNFLEQAIITAKERFPLASILLISREFPSINISSLMIRNSVFMINEEELNFTESELHQFLLQQGLSSETNSISKIYRDTKGWAFIINFVARILKKTPGYAGYASGAIRQDISRLLEAEAWDVISDRLKRFFLRLSLTAHRSMELVNILAEGDESLIAELKEQNLFVRYDRHIDAYHIHHLFLDFLHTKQSILADDEIRNTYKMIADWCVKNDFIVDALLAYEKIGDYESIVSTLFTSPVEVLQNNAPHIVKIFDRAPEKIFDSVEFSAAIHVHSLICNGEWQEALALIRHYETKYLQLPADSAFRNHMLGYIYYLMGALRMVLCTADGCHDFDIYFAKQYECLKNFPVNPKCWYQHTTRLWTGLAGSAEAGALQEYADALKRSMRYIEKCIADFGVGLDDLCQGELFFYQSDIREAELYFARTMERARGARQYQIVSRALFYIMRIAVYQGDYAKLELALKDVERQLAYNEYSFRFLTYDIVVGWHYYTLCLPERIPDWLKEKFAYSVYASASENFGNYIKAKYSYLTGNYTELLDYLGKKKRQGTMLYERVESLAMEACVHVKMNNKKAALYALQEAYEAAQPNGIVMPFIELGKAMQSLINIAADSQECAIPHLWLKNIKQRTSAYFRNQSRIISEYKKIHKIDNKILLSPRETDILHDLHAGLSRGEIADRHTLSVNTVKLHINSIYNKLGARNRADIFRIAAEYSLV